MLVPLSTVLAAPDPTAGKALYQTNCASCHGADGAGGIKVGDATAPDIRWSGIGETFNNDAALVRRAILTGQDEEGKDVDAAMPRFKGKLTDAQADDIVAFLQTLKAPALPKSGDPLGSQALLLVAVVGGLLLVGGLRLRRAAR
jgi:mono/diheme cytochrome c family protein